MPPKPSVLLPISKLFPNAVTLIGLCIGLFALKNALAGKWEVAVGFIIIAAFIDGVDGRLARMLNATSSFGAQLDSLSDFFNFNVAPALMLYMWHTHEVKAFGWMASLFFIICGALRLARFNVSAEEDEESEDDKLLKESFFVGIPVPAAACLSLLPMILTFLSESKGIELHFSMHPIGMIIFMTIIAFLMVSRIPTISLKKIKIRKELSSVILAGFALFIICLILEPWVVLPIMGVGYLLLIPYSIWKYNLMKRSLGI